MPLEKGSRLGPHEIIEAVGAGGMGEVYRARDTRLDRIVAIKVLPAHLAENPALQQRLERPADHCPSMPWSTHWTALVPVPVCVCGGVCVPDGEGVRWRVR